MTVDSTQDPVLVRFRAALEDTYGERIARVVLFISRARDDARSDSDYDIGLFLNDMEGLGRESEILAEIETNLLFETGIVIVAIPFPIRDISFKLSLAIASGYSVHDL